MTLPPPAALTRYGALPTGFPSNALGGALNRPSIPNQARNADLLNELRGAIPNQSAEYLGRLDEDDPMSIVEAYLYLRQARVRVPGFLYVTLQRRALEVLGVDPRRLWAEFETSRGADALVSRRPTSLIPALSGQLLRHSRFCDSVG